MRNVWLISYDISDPKRLRRTYEFLRGWGEHLQLSVFRCELASAELVRVRAGLTEIIHAREDQILLADLGPAEGRGADCIRTLGRTWSRDERTAIVL